MRGAARQSTAPRGPTVGAFAARDRGRDLLRRAFPRRVARLVLCRTSADLRSALGRTLVDAVVVDVVAATDDAWKAASLAAEFPCIPFYGIAGIRSADAPAIGRCASLGFADVLAEGLDDSALRDLVLQHGFRTRFAAAVGPAHEVLGLVSPAQLKAWAWVLAQGGGPVRTDLLARALGVTREHLSRTFATGGAPNLKRVIDLVRVIAAAELAKCPGYDPADVARVLEFASPSHLASTAQRVCGSRSASLARLRTGDILERFREGRARSRS